MNENMGNIIMQLRKERGMTQEQLANALGITFQAVSKWENGVSSPDISALPLLAELFGVSIDELFGRAPLSLTVQEAKEETIREKIADSPALPWPDDETFYAVLYHGHSLIGHLAGDEQMEEAKKHFVFQYEGPVQNIFSDFSVEIEGDVAGSIEAGTSVSCGDVQGDVISGGNTNCGDVNGSVRSSGSVSCGDIGMGLEAGGNVDCGDVGGGVSAGGGAACGDVGGNVNAGASVNCSDVGGSVYAGTKVQCDTVEGTVAAGGYTSKRKRTGSQKQDEDFDQALDEMIDRQIEDSIRLGMGRFGYNEDEEHDEDDEEEETGFSDTFDGENFGDALSRTINQAVQKAMELSNKFRPRRQEKEPASEEE